MSIGSLRSPLHVPGAPELQAIGATPQKTEPEGPRQREPDLAPRPDATARAGRDVRAAHGASGLATSPNGVVGVRSTASRVPRLEVEVEGRKLALERDADGAFVVRGAYRQHDERAGGAVRSMLRDNPGQLALAVHALHAVGEPKRQLSELTWTEATQIGAAVEGALAKRPTGPKRALLRDLKDALAEALTTPRLASAARTRAAAHPLLGDCTVAMEVGGRSFAFQIEGGELQGSWNRADAEDRLLALLAVGSSDALRAPEKAHLTGLLTPELVRDADGAQQMTLAESYRSTLVRRHPDGRMESKKGSEDWAPIVSPAHLLLFRAALAATSPDEARAFDATLFGRYGTADGSGTWYGGYSNVPEKAFVGLLVDARQRTNFFAGGYQAYRWSDNPLWNTTGAAVYALTALCTVAAREGRSVLEEMRPVLDFAGSRFTLRDLRGESESISGHVADRGAQVKQWYPGYYAPSGYAYEREGHKAPGNAVFGAYIAAQPFLAQELGWAPLASQATIELRDGELEERRPG